MFPFLWGWSLRRKQHLCQKWVVNNKKLHKICADDVQLHGLATHVVVVSETKAGDYPVATKIGTVNPGQIISHQSLLRHRISIPLCWTRYPVHLLVRLKREVSGQRPAPFQCWLVYAVLPKFLSSPRRQWSTSWSLSGQARWSCPPSFAWSQPENKLRTDEEPLDSKAPEK